MQQTPTALEILRSAGPLAMSHTEAPASATVHLLIRGKAVALTLRDTDEARVLARISVIITAFPDQPLDRSTPQAPRGRK